MPEIEIEEKFCTYCGAPLEPMKDDVVRWYTAKEGKPVYRLDFVCPKRKWWYPLNHDRINGHLYPNGRWERIFYE